jgi:glycosyltransferase involved in cell wall biosynthesis
MRSPRTESEASAPPAARPVVALVAWGLIFEDFLRPNHLTLDVFCDDFTGSWMFGYVDALRAAGVETMIVCVSSGVDVVTRRVHGPTGATICLLPVPRPYRLLRAAMRSPHGRTVATTFKGPRAALLALLPMLFLLKELAPFISMPLRTFAEQLKSEGCRVVLCQEYEFPRFDVCVLLSRLMNVRVFATFQGGDYQRWRVERFVRPITVRRADGLIIAPAAERDRVRTRYGETRVAPIPNPIDLGTWHRQDRAAARRTLGISDAARVAAWHGRVDVSHKGLDILLSAWADVSRHRADAVLVMIGTGRDAALVRGWIGELGLENVVWIGRFLHDGREIARLLASADVYAFSSRHEGFPVAPIEAMACGLPVVAADVGGIEDIFAGGEASGGVVVPSENPKRLAEEILRVFDDEALRQRLAAAAAARAEAFGSEAIGRRLSSFLFADSGLAAVVLEQP